MPMTVNIVDNDDGFDATSAEAMTLSRAAVLMIWNLKRFQKYRRS